LNRLAFFRWAFEEHLKRVHVADLEERDRLGYQNLPQHSEEYRPWEEAAALAGRLRAKAADSVQALKTISLAASHTAPTVQTRLCRSLEGTQHFTAF
jgi:hypothetical protein